MAQDGIDMQAGDTFQVIPWSITTQEETAQRGIEVFMGLIGRYHANCPIPTHFWCAPPQNQVLALVELYLASNAEGGGYIGCYMRGAGADENGRLAVQTRPSLKALMQLMDNGHVLVQFGGIAEDPSGRSAYGLVDRNTVEYLMVRPRSMPEIPAVTGSGLAFMVQRARDEWVIARCLDFGSGQNVSQAMVFAQVPVDPNPSPLTRMDFTNFPPNEPAT